MRKIIAILLFLLISGLCSMYVNGYFDSPKIKAEMKAEVQTEPTAEPKIEQTVELKIEPKAVATPIYTAECFVAWTANPDLVVVETTVKGPATKLAITITSPEGSVVSTQAVEKNQIVNDSFATKLSIQNPHEGTYVLAVKTVDPEKNVCQKDVLLSIGQVKINNVWGNVRFNGDRNGNFEIILTSIVVDVVRTSKGVNLPVKFTGLSSTLNGRECPLQRISSNNEIIFKLENPIARVGANLCFNETVRYGEKYVVKGTLFYNGGNLPFYQYLNLDEAIASQNKFASQIAQRGRAQSIRRRR